MPSTSHQPPIEHRAEASESEVANLLPPAWKTKLKLEFQKNYFKSLTAFLNREESEGREIFPPRHLRFRAFFECDFERVRVVILGQDPYHGPEQAIGLAFGVPNHLRLKPPSLQNILKELRVDLGQSPDKSASDLTGWARQGVLLLNTVLTVRRSQAFSHRGQGWETFTDEVIKRLDERKKPLVFILWGAAAVSKKKLIISQQHRVLESPHPSPLSASRGFFGSKPFSKANQILAQLGDKPIDWLNIS